LADINRSTTGELPLYKGVAHGAFDGELQVLDVLGGHSRAVLVLTAGGKQVRCVVANAPEEEVRAAWKRRCIVHGIAHYNGESGLPEEIDIRSIVPVRQDAPPFSNWRGAFEIPIPDDDGWN
jgi:hypothetical protein